MRKKDLKTLAVTGYTERWPEGKRVVCLMVGKKGNGSVSI